MAAEKIKVEYSNILEVFSKGRGLMYKISFESREEIS